MNTRAEILQFNNFRSAESPFHNFLLGKLKNSDSAKYYRMVTQQKQGFMEMVAHLMSSYTIGIIVLRTVVLSVHGNKNNRSTSGLCFVKATFDLVNVSTHHSSSCRTSLHFPSH